MENKEILQHLHPQQIPSLELLPGDKAVALLTRHSIREEPKNRFAGFDVPLTELGVDLAHEWGRQIAMPISSFYSSPVERCVDTAQAMAKGAGLEMEVKTHSSLVEPGSYVQDLPIAGPYFFKLGPLAFAQKHLRNEVRGVLTPLEGARNILSHIKGSLGDSGTLSVHVTHDTILAAFIYFLRQESELEEAHWPWMMEGAFLWFDDDAVHWVWRGESGHFAIAL